MKIVIIGTGAAGWMACNNLVHRQDVTEIVIIGSSKLPTIGVGESTTGRFDDYLETINAQASDFIRESDATVKYGVYYHRWSPKDFLHSLKSENPYHRMGTYTNEYLRLLGKKDPARWLHEYIDDISWDMVKRNHVSMQAQDIEQRMRYQWEPTPNPPSEYTNSWQFEANKFIGFMRRLASKNPKITELDAKVIGVEGDIDALVLEDGTKITADFFIISTGETKFNEEVFGCKYTSLSNYLLTDRALFTPLEYVDKRNQIHPYTVAQAMKYGWRWITPTYSRIGTGYAFSSSHVSDDEAIDEFRKDIGDMSIDPFVVDFKPRRLDNPYRANHVFLGMAAGFMEPLDAPGLDLVAGGIIQINELLDAPKEQRAEIARQKCEHFISSSKWWTSFILCQYKTSHRNDSQFWTDHKNVDCAFYDELMANLADIKKYYNSTAAMFYSTIAGKDITWDCGDDLRDVELKPVMEAPLPTIHHLDWLESIRGEG